MGIGRCGIMPAKHQKSVTMKIGVYPAKRCAVQELELGCFETRSGSFVSYSRSGEKQLLEGRKQSSKAATVSPKQKKPEPQRRSY